MRWQRKSDSQRVVERAAFENRGFSSQQVLDELEQAIRTMRLKDYGTGDLSPLMADLVLSVVHPLFRVVWIRPEDSHAL